MSECQHAGFHTSSSVIGSGKNLVWGKVAVACCFCCSLSPASPSTVLDKSRCPFGPMPLWGWLASPPVQQAVVAVLLVPLPSAPHTAIRDADDLRSTEADDLLRRSPQNRFLYLHRPLPGVFRVAPHHSLLVICSTRISPYADRCRRSDLIDPEI